MTTTVSKTSTPTFIVSTGRVGSTMLSTMMKQHPDLLSLSELFIFLTDLGGRIPQAFESRTIDGDEFWEMLTAAYPRQSLLMQHNVTFSEVLYPYQSSQSIFSGSTGVPAILQVTLPHLTSDYDQLFLELQDFIRATGAQPLRTHYDNLFKWLITKFEKQQWVERSGGNFTFIHEMLKLYPDARYIHLFRDGRNAAISMSKHLGFRIFLIASMMTKYLGIDPYLSDNRSNLSDLPKDLQCFLPEQFDPQAFLDYQPAHEILGQIWSNMIVKGVNALQQLDQEQVLHVEYEAFCDAPEYHLDRMIEFMGVERDSEWIAHVCQMVKISRTSWQDLPIDKKIALEKVCAPGMAMLEDIKI